VIDVAAETGVRHLVYMPIYHKAGSTFTHEGNYRGNIFSIEKMRSSGLAYTLVQHPPFMEPAMVYAGPNAVETGVSGAGSNGKFTAATRDDLAAAHAAVLTDPGTKAKPTPIGRTGRLVGRYCPDSFGYSPARMCLTSRSRMAPEECRFHSHRSTVPG